MMKMMKGIPVQLVLIGLLSVSSLFGAETGALRVGAAKVDASPPENVFPYPQPHGQSFVGIHDPLYARAIMIDNGVRQMAIVTLDAARVPEVQKMTKRIADSVGIPEQNVMLSATHTHNEILVDYYGDIMNFEEKRDPQQAVAIDQFINSAAEAVRQAKANLQPARLEFGRGESYLNVGDGASDRSVDVIKFESLAGAPIAILMNYGVHAQVVFNSVTKGDNGFEISGDLPGATSSYVEDHYKGKAVAVWTLGAAADQQPAITARQAGSVSDGSSSWAVLNAVARRLGKTVVDVADSLNNPISNAEIRIAHKVVTCPGAPFTREAKTNYPRYIHTQESDDVRAEGSAPIDVPISISLFSINDIALVGVSGEVASEIGMHLKLVSPRAHTTMVTLAGGDIGYLYADARYKNPAGKLREDPLKPGCAEAAIVSGALDLMIHLAGTK